MAGSAKDAAWVGDRELMGWRVAAGLAAHLSVPWVFAVLVPAVRAIVEEVGAGDVEDTVEDVEGTDEEAAAPFAAEVLLPDRAAAAECVGTVMMFRGGAVVTLGSDFGNALADKVEVVGSGLPLGVRGLPLGVRGLAAGGERLTEAGAIWSGGGDDFGDAASCRSFSVSCTSRAFT